MTPEFRVGLFVLLGLFMVAAFSFKFNTDPNVGGRVKKYELVLPNATGLTKGAKISIAGIPIGVIEDIHLEKGKAHLTLSVKSDLPLTQSALVEVKSEGILGDKRLELFVGNPSDPQLPEGSLIPKYKDESGMEAVMNQVTKMADDLAAVTDSLKKATSGDGDEDTTLGRTLKNVEEITADLSEIAADQKENLKETLNNLHSVTTTLNEMVNDETDAGLKANFKKMSKSLGRVDSILKNVEDVSEKVKNGEGTIGKLLTDDTTIDEVNKAVASVNTALDTASKIQLDMDFHSEMLAGSMSKSFIGVTIQPGPDRYYMAQVVDDPKGKYEQILNYQTVNGVTTLTNTQNIYKNQMKFSLQFAKTLYDFTVRGGMIESAGGVGLDYSFFRRKVKINTEIFNFSRTEGPDLRAWVRYKFWNVFYLEAGGDDILNTTGNPLTGTSASGFIGAGLDFTNDDLKLILTKGF